ncbi:MAG: DUF4368 domain-containing protein [Lachnospiraceae bacterium]|nr:DUF4368 domain-containing protein [Lachnospiraceae bacterium]MDY4165712.1 DUF4368 domain-containing protein [Lachnospiraceae bacterium]
MADSEAVAKKLMTKADALSASESRRLKKQVKKDSDRIHFLDKLIAKLYEDQISGKISEENFDTLLDKYQKEQSGLKKRLEKDIPAISCTDRARSSINDWVEEVRKFADVRELTRDMLQRLIREIVVYEKIDKDKNRDIRIEIHYNFSQNK